MSENNRKTICVCCIFIQQIILGFLQWVRKLLNFRVMLPIFAWIMYIVALAIGGCFVYRTFWGQDNNVLESINISINDEKGKKKELSPEGKAYLMEQLHTALMEVSGKAEAAYNEKFATLLTVLTIFGIAWPLILGLIQFRFNERELKKIQKTKRKIDIVEQTAKEAKDQAISAANTASDAFTSAIDNQSVLEELKSVKNNIYNDIPFVYQTIASYLCHILVPPAPATEKAIKDFFKSSAFALEMGLNGLYYACLSDNKMVITDMQKRVLNHLRDLDKEMGMYSFAERQPMSHLNSFSWDIIQSKVEPKVFSEIKDLYDKHFYKEGEK